MSIDKSLKTSGKLARPRNVLTRIERIKMLKEDGKWNPSISVFGIPKVKVMKAKQKGKSAEKKAEKAEAVAVKGVAPKEAVAATPVAGKEKAKK
ncbi:MAG: small basic protein [Planctomycetota bacterium]